MMPAQELNTIISMTAVVAFAVTAVLAVRVDKDIDLLAAAVLGIITAVGGGTIRDVIIDAPVFWAKDLSYVWVALGASVATFYGRKLLAGRYVFGLLLYVDGFGATMFGIQAAGKVWDLNFGVPVAPVILGVVTAIGGGLIRDILAGRTTLLMRPELYTTPVLLGCIVYTAILKYLPEHREMGKLLCILGTFALRAAAIHWNLTLPAFAHLKRDATP